MLIKIDWISRWEYPGYFETKPMCINTDRVDVIEFDAVTLGSGIKFDIIIVNGREVLVPKYSTEILLLNCGTLT